MTLLSVTNVSKAYSGAPALIDASLDLQAGEVHALMGENGAGKSTLIKVLAGVVVPDTCAVALNGAEVRLDGPQDAFEHGLRFIHQELNVIPQLSVAENLFLGHRYPRRLGAFVDWKSINRRAHQALARLQIFEIDPQMKMARLSTGDQMLVRIASALVSDDNSAASIFVMDEPTAALTGEESERLFQVIRGLRSSGCAILYVSHRMDEVMRICDRVTVMRDGHTIKTTAIADTDKKEIIRLMTGRDVADAYPPRTGEIGPATVLNVRSLASAPCVQYLLHAAQGRNSWHRRPRQCRPERTPPVCDRSGCPAGARHRHGRRGAAKANARFGLAARALPMCRRNGARKGWCFRVASPRTSRFPISAAPALCRSFWTAGGSAGWLVNSAGRSA